MSEIRTGIDLDENLLGVWFLDINESSNWFAGLSCTKTAGRLQLKYRVRYFSDGTARNARFDPNAEASWAVAEMSKSPDQAIEDMRRIGRTLTQHARGELIEVLRGDRTFEQFQVALAAQPFWVVGPTLEESRSPGIG